MTNRITGNFENINDTTAIAIRTMNKAPLFPRDFKNIALYSAITILITFFTVLGSTDASLHPHLFHHFTDRILAFIALIFGIFMINEKWLFSLKNKRLMSCLMASTILSYLVIRLIVIQIDKNMVSLSSYLNIYGTVFIFFLVITPLFTLKHLILFIHTIYEDKSRIKGEILKCLGTIFIFIFGSLCFLTLFPLILYMLLYYLDDLGLKNLLLR